MHRPDQAKHNKPSLDANGRLEVIFYDVLCIAQKKNRRERLSYDQLSLGVSQWITLGQIGSLSQALSGFSCVWWRLRIARHFLCLLLVRHSFRLRSCAV